MPAPGFSPTPASSPGAPPAGMTAMATPTGEGAVPDEFFTATPRPSPTLIPGSMPPAGPLHVGMSRDEAIRRTLGMLNPNGSPTIEEARLTTLGLLAQLQAETGRADLPPDPPRQPGALVYVVVAQQADDLLHGNNLSPGFHTFTAMYDAVTGETGGWSGSDAPPALPTTLPSFEGRATVVAPPTLTPWPEQPGVQTAVPPPPSPTPNHAAVPHGAPFQAQAADPAVLTALGAYPLLPGNRWTYRHDLYDDYRWCGETVTRTVQSAELFRPELLLVRERVDHRAADCTTDAVLDHFLDSRESHADTEYDLLWRDELYRSADPAQVVGWLRHFNQAPPIPTMVPCEYDQDLDAGCFVPTLRLPVAVGQRIPAPEVGGYWDWRLALPLRTPAGLFEGCFEASSGGLDDRWRLVCPGIGLVREEWVHTSMGGPWSITQLLSWRLPWTLGRGP